MNQTRLPNYSRCPLNFFNRVYYDVSFTEFGAGVLPAVKSDAVVPLRIRYSILEEFEAAVLLNIRERFHCAMNSGAT